MCDDSWSVYDTVVACNQLGYGYGQCIEECIFMGWGGAGGDRANHIIYIYIYYLAAIFFTGNH